MKLDVFEEEEKSESKKILNVAGPFFKLRVSRDKLEVFGGELEKLKEKYANLDRACFAFIFKNSRAVPPKLADKNFDLGECELDATVVAIRDEIYKQLSFNPKPKQKKL